jgi:SSS family solute:Na+ symporter
MSTFLAGALSHPIFQSLIIAAETQAAARTRLQAGDWIVIGMYGLGMLLVGWYYARRVHSEEDYLLGGRNMGSIGVGLSLFATLLSTITYLGFPGEMIKYGPMLFCQMAAYPFVFLLVGWLLIPYFMKERAVTAYEILEIKLGVSVRMLGASLFLLLRLAWMGLVMQATASVLLPLAGMPESTSWAVCAVLGLVTIIYTSMGGLRAVVWTDVVQTLILFGGALLALTIITWELGGVGAWMPTEWVANWEPPQFGFNPQARVTFMDAFLAGLLWWVCTAGSDQVAVQRYLATRNAKTARRVLGTSLLSNVFVNVLLAAVGLALLAYFKQNPHLMSAGASITDDADQLFPRYIVVGLPVGLSGLVIAGLLAAAMSSLSSGINSSCSVISIDFIGRFSRSDAPKSSHIGRDRLISLIIGTLVVGLSIWAGSVEGNLMARTFRISNLLVAPLFLLFAMAIFVPFARPFGTIVGVIAAVIVAVGIAFGNWMSFVWIMPASLAVGLAVAMLVSLLPISSRPPTAQLPPAVEEPQASSR